MHWVDLLTTEEDILRSCDKACEVTSGLERLDLTVIEHTFDISKYLKDIKILLEEMRIEIYKLEEVVTSPNEQDCQVFDISNHNECIKEKMYELLKYIVDIEKQLTTIRNEFDCRINDIYSSYI